MSKNTDVTVTLTKDELQIIIFVMDEWRTIMSDRVQGVIYPNRTATSSSIIRKLYKIFENL